MDKLLEVMDSINQKSPETKLIESVNMIPPAVTDAFALPSTIVSKPVQSALGLKLLTAIESDTSLINNRVESMQFVELIT